MPPRVRRSLLAVWFFQRLNFFLLFLSGSWIEIAEGGFGGKKSRFSVLFLYTSSNSCLSLRAGEGCALLSLPPVLLRLVGSSLIKDS